MKLGEQLKRIRTLKGLSQKEVMISASIDKAQLSRIENGKTDPTFSTIERITKAMGVSLVELFTTSEDFKEVHSIDKSLIEKVQLIEQLDKKERNTIYFMLDSFLGKQKLKDVLSNALNDI